MDDLGFAAKVCNAVSAKCADVGFGGLTDAEKVLEMVSSLDFEVTMGGLWQYYYNSAGEHAEKVVGAMEMIGAVEAARIMRKANSVFPGGVPPRDRGKRMEVLKQWDKTGASPLDKITKEFYEKVELSGYVDRFVLEHREEFEALDLAGEERPAQMCRACRVSYAEIQDRMHEGMYLAEVKELVGEDGRFFGITSRAAETISFRVELADVVLKVKTDKDERVLSWKTKPLSEPR